MSIVAGGDDGDWLSSTIRMVETVMVRHGFLDDKPQSQHVVPHSTDEKRREWIKTLAAALRLQKSP